MFVKSAIYVEEVLNQPTRRLFNLALASTLPESCVFSFSVCYLTNVGRESEIEKEQHNILGRSIARAQKNESTGSQAKQINTF